MIRDFKTSDLEPIVALFNRSVRDIAGRDYSAEQVSAWAPDPPDLKAWARRLGSGGVFVYDDDERILGFARIDDSGCVDMLYVLPGMERRGIGRALIDRSVSWAVERGIRRLFADVSITARPFFESVGFCVTADQVVERRGVLFRNFRMERDERSGD